MVGRISIQIDSQDPLQVILGSFDLDDGQKRAPFTNKELFPASKCPGGKINVTIHLDGIKKDTVFTNLLRNVTDASLGILKGILETSAPQSIINLKAASGALIDGVKSIIINQDDKDFEIFDPNSGIEDTISADNLNGQEFYLLFHRGSMLDNSKIEIKKSGHIEYVYYNGQPLEDGAWVLLQIGRIDEFPLEREWAGRLNDFRDNIMNLISDVFDLKQKTHYSKQQCQ